MLKHLHEQIRGPVPNKKQRGHVIQHLRGKRSLEIQHYLNAMRNWIGEREMGQADLCYLARLHFGTKEVYFLAAEIGLPITTAHRAFRAEKAF
jgi:hypothetical protein